MTLLSEIDTKISEVNAKYCGHFQSRPEVYCRFSQLSRRLTKMSEDNQKMSEEIKLAVSNVPLVIFIEYTLNKYLFPDFTSKIRFGSW